MADAEDIVEAVLDIEDIVEEVAEPEDLLEDFVENPLLIVFALVAAATALFTLLLLAAAVIFLVFAVGPVAVVVALALVGLVLSGLAVAGFVYFRTDIPSDIQQKIETARQRSADTPEHDATMSEQEAIDELKSQYAQGELTDRELERALEEVMTSDDPERVVERSR